MLTGYGGYGFSLKPRFDPGWLPWLEQGGVLAVAHTRGGGEYGEEWHHAGRLAAKQNVFDDFAACARFLVESHVTTSGRLQRRYSPYHNVEDGTAYPAVLLTVGEFDPRVDAYHAKKMAAPAGSNLIRPASAPAGRVGRTRPRNSLDQRVSELTDIYAFLFDRLDINYRRQPTDTAWHR